MPSERDARKQKEDLQQQHLEALRESVDLSKKASEVYFHAAKQQEAYALCHEKLKDADRRISDDDGDDNDDDKNKNTVCLLLFLRPLIACAENRLPSAQRVRLGSLSRSPNEIYALTPARLCSFGSTIRTFV
jgi:exonuclease VII small subunit